MQGVARLFDQIGLWRRPVWIFEAIIYQTRETQTTPDSQKRKYKPATHFGRRLVLIGKRYRHDRGYFLFWNKQLHVIHPLLTLWCSLFFFFTRTPNWGYTPRSGLGVTPSPIIIATWRASLLAVVPSRHVPLFTLSNTCTPLHYRSAFHTFRETTCQRHPGSHTTRLGRAASQAYTYLGMTAMRR